MTAVQRMRAKLGIKTTDAAKVLTLATRVYLMMLAAVAKLPNPVPTMVAFLALITNLKTAADAMEQGGKGLKAAREAQRAPVVTALEKLLGYVQGIADGLSPTDAYALIMSSGFGVATSPSHAKNGTLAATQAHAGAAVMLEANVGALQTALAAAGLGKASGHRSFDWEGTIVANVPNVANTVVRYDSGPNYKIALPIIPPGTNMSFRVRIVGMKGPGAWSDPVTLPVH